MRISKTGSMNYAKARLRLAELVPYSTQVHLRDIFISRAKRRFTDVVKEVSALLGSDPTVDLSTGSKAKKAIRELPQVAELIQQLNVNGSAAGGKYILNLITDAVVGTKSPRAATTKLSAFLVPLYTKYQQDIAKRPMLEAGLPEDFIKQLLPKSFSFTVSPNGDLVEEISTYGNQVKTEMAKTTAMAEILERWNELADTLNRDLQSTDEFTKLCALVTSIIAHTGIRPGTEGESRMKDEAGKLVRDAEGKPVRIKTVGATGLRPEHVQFIREDFAQLRFYGKAATLNIAELSNATLLRVLREQVEAVRSGEGDFIFVTKQGEKITDQDINSYLRSVIGTHITATDFRKLKATRTFFDSLRRRKEELAEELRQLKEEIKDDLKTKIVETVLRHIMVSAEDAQKAISHSDVKVTIESYISPRVVLEYLTNAGLDRGLEEVVSRSHGMRIRFDPMDFYHKMIQPELRAAGLRCAETAFFFGDSFAEDDITEIINYAET